MNGVSIALASFCYGAHIDGLGREHSGGI